LAGASGQQTIPTSAEGIANSRLPITQTILVAPTGKDATTKEMASRVLPKQATIFTNIFPHGVDSIYAAKAFGGFY